MDFYAFLSYLVHTYGYLGVFLANLISSASVIFPLPGVLFVATLATVLNPFLVAVAGGLGAAIGEITAYLLGRGSKELIERKYEKEFDKFNKDFEKYGGLLVIGMAATPFPFDVVGIFCGVMEYPIKKFFVATLIGKCLRNVLIAYASMYSVSWLVDFYHANNMSVA